MPTYTWPGVYVEEVPSAVKPIAGVGTSTAAFIGVSADITRPGIPRRRRACPPARAAAPTRRRRRSPPGRSTAGPSSRRSSATSRTPTGTWRRPSSGSSTTEAPAAGSPASARPATSWTRRCSSLESIDEVAIVAAPLPPDVAAEALNAAQAALVAHCEKMEDRVAILDSGRDIANDNLVITTDATGIWRPAANPKGYGAFYFPWILVADPLGQPGDRVAVPPSGHLAGIYARSDAERGVHKAPANEVILGALDVSYPVSKILQGSLNPLGVNCIRSFTGTIKVYGARTLASDPAGDPEWTYVSVRRLVNFLRESIEEGTQWVVFEPNAADLWSKIRRNVSAFLNGEWAAGALVGATPEQAFYVVCDETTNPAEVRDAGPGGHRDRRGAGTAGRVRRLPPQPVGRPGAVAGDDRTFRHRLPDARGLPAGRVPAARAGPADRRACLPRLRRRRTVRPAAAADAVAAVPGASSVPRGRAASWPTPCAASSRTAGCCATWSGSTTAPPRWPVSGPGWRPWRRSIPSTWSAPRTS